MLAAKMFDPIMGVDIHFIQPLVPVPPVPVPHPFVGMVIDGSGMRVMINSRPSATVGSFGVGLPKHTPIGGSFVKPPTDQAEIYTGSATVLANGEALSRMLELVLTCQDIGMPPPPRKRSVNLNTLVLPTSKVYPILDGRPVIVGGPSTISASALSDAAKAALSTLLNRMWNLLRKVYIDPLPDSVVKGVELARRRKLRLFGDARDLAKSKLRRLVRRSQSHNKGCGRAGEPVCVVTGANIDDFLDFELPGPRGFVWKRYYNSAWNKIEGPMGRSFRHEFQRELRRTSSSFSYIDHEGDEVEFPDFPPDENVVIADGLQLIREDEDTFKLVERHQPTMVFHLKEGAGRAPLRALERGADRLEFKYDRQGDLSGIRNSGHWRIRFLYDGRGHIESLHLGESQSEERLIARYRYDGDGNLIEWQDALGSSAINQYDAANRMIKKTDRNGYSFHYEYGEDGRCIRTRGDDGLYDLRFEYVPQAQYTAVVHADGGVWHYLYNEDGTITEIIDPYNQSTLFILDDDGRVTKEIDPAGNRTRYLYDDNGCHTGRRDPLGYNMGPMHIEPNPPDPLTYRLPTTACEWEHGSLLKRRTLTSPEPDEPVLKSMLADFMSRSGGLTADNDAASVLADRNQRLPPVRQVFDEQRQLLEKEDADGKTQTWEYDPNGNVISYRDRDGSSYRINYSSWNLRSRDIDPLGNATSFEYSTREQVTRVTDAGGTETDYVYDLKDRLVEVHRHGALRESYHYDGADNLIEKLDDEGNTLLSFEVIPGGLHSVRRLSSGENHYFEYDERGRITRAATDELEVFFTYDNEQMLSDERGGKGVTHEFAGSQSSKTILFGRFAIGYTRHEDGGLVVEDPTGTSQRFHHGHRGLVSRHLSNGSTELSGYSPHGRCLLKIIENRSRSGRISRRYYSYSAEGDLEQIDDFEQGVTRYTCDAAHRLTMEILPNGEQHQYVHDAAGNLIEQPGLIGVLMDAGNRLKVANGNGFIYDNRNNLTFRAGPSGMRRFKYDSRDMLVAWRNEEMLWTAKYDPLGRRVMSEWEDNKVEFYWDDFRLAAEILSDGRLRQYIYPDPEAIVPFMFVEYSDVEADPKTGQRFFLFTNQIGVPIRVEDDDGEPVWSVRVEPYGRVHVSPDSAIELNLRFPGHYYDPVTGLHYNRWRYYSPELGRYIQSDPLGLAGGINLYSYPANPLADVDLDGLHAKQVGLNKGKKGKRKTGVDVEGVPSPPSIDRIMEE